MRLFGKKENWFEKYRRHKLKTLSVPSDEYDRLSKLSSSAPGPTPWTVSVLPALRGPGELELRWRKAGSMQIVLGNEESRQDFLAFGGYCYIHCIGAGQLCFWYHRAKTDHGLRLTILDTSSLKALPSIPNLEVRRTSSELPVEFLSDTATETNIAYPKEYGQLTHRFPESMRSLPELLVLGSVGTHGPKNQSVWVMKSSLDTIDALPMDWWNKGDYDYGYEWVTRLARDSKTGNIVGSGVRILPFLLDSSGNFLGWLIESK